MILDRPTITLGATGAGSCPYTEVNDTMATAATTDTRILFVIWR
jgi:hypothetical protein